MFGLEKKDESRKKNLKYVRWNIDFLKDFIYNTVWQIIYHIRGDSAKAIGIDAIQLKKYHLNMVTSNRGLVTPLNSDRHRIVR